MADVKISALPAVVTAATTDIFAIVQGGVTYKATLTQVVTAITSTGLTATAGALTVNLSTGVAGGQSVIGGTAASENLTLSSTSNATKGKLLFGTSAYDEVNNRLGIGTASPGSRFSITSTTGGVALASFRASGTPTPVLLIEDGDVTIPNYTGAGFVIAPTSNTCGYLTSSSASTGGFTFQGFTSNNNTGNPLIFVGNHGGTSPTTAALWFFGRKHNGTTAFNPLVNSEIIAGFNPGSGNDVMQILANANVLINTTTDAGFRLDVNGTARVQGNTTITGQLTATTAFPTIRAFSSSGTDSAGYQAITNNGTGNGGSFLSYGSGVGFGLGGNTAFGSSSSIILFTDSAVASGGTGSIQFRAGGFDSTQERVRINNTGNVLIGTTTDAGFRLDVNGTARVQGDLTISTKNIITDTTTGTKIGTGNTQKLGFWNATPIAQPTTAVAAATLVGGGGTTLTDTDTFDGYTLQQVVKALRNAGLLA